MTIILNKQTFFFPFTTICKYLYGFTSHLVNDFTSFGLYKVS